MTLDNEQLKQRILANGDYECEAGMDPSSALPACSIALFADMADQVCKHLSNHDYGSAHSVAATLASQLRLVER